MVRIIYQTNKEVDTKLDKEVDKRLTKARI